MKINEFFAYKTKCVVCQSDLTQIAQVNVLVDKIAPSQHDFSLAGILIYNYDGKKFHISNVVSKKQEDLIFTIKEDFPKTFSINKKFHPSIKRTTIATKINPWFVSSIDVKLIRSCVRNKHCYYFETMYIWEEDKAEVEIAREVLEIHGIRLFNEFENNKPFATRTGNSGLDVYKLYDETPHDLPYIPIEKWDISTEDNLKEQINKYTLLK